MAQLLLTARQLLVKLVQWLLMLMLLAMTGVMFAQIIWRYLLQSPLVWSEELALLLMVWMTFLGSALMLERKEHVAIDLLVEWLPPALNRATQIVGALVVLAFNLALTYGALLIVETAKESIMPGLKISSAWQYMGVLIGGGLLVLVSIEALLRALRGAAATQEKRS
ncbi:TRAP dicarboxylate family transporter subunit DctQ [Nitratireductor pacificus pht-3B]|uniref:TRAP transporter small permease protein n=2 Tax=Nitratireductor TaxID=245876 RepID=K2MI92_9HYPH|nr:TRAP dicarboxylate family transporter subunit DctQ [Nitratireductor pacificus pht-3B]